MKILNTLLSTNNSAAPLIARLTLAIVIFPHGAQKLLGWYGGYGFSGTMGFFTDTMGIPAVFGFLAIVAEFFGPIALALGVFSRASALLVGVTMAVAMFMVTWSNGFFMNWYGNQAGEGYQFHLLTLGLSLLVAVSGGGMFSVDRILSKSPGEEA